MKTYIFNPTRGAAKKCIIRHAIGEKENKKHFVLEIYFDGRNYPNVISGKYKTLKNCKQAMRDYIFSDKIPVGDI